MLRSDEFASAVRWTSSDEASAAVAREENTSQPTVSKVIAALEQHLQVRLLERTTTSLTPTEEGKRFYERSKRIIEEYADAVADARVQTRKVIGALRINAPVGLGELRLNALILDFMAEHPEVDIELIVNDRMVDLVEEGVDVAIRLGGEPRRVCWLRPKSMSNMPPRSIIPGISHSTSIFALPDWRWGTGWNFPTMPRKSLS